MSSGKLYNGDCLAVMKTMPDNSVSSIVTDPPYGLKFMSKKWDYDVPSVEIWKEALRVLKPGGTALIFAGSRTQHRMAVNIEDAGFVLKDVIMWIYGSGFPKSTDISKRIDLESGAKREVVGNTGRDPNRLIKFKEQDGCKRKPTNEDITKPATPAAQLWEGYGTALKPAYEPIIVAMKPNDGTYANNALKHGVAGINVDASRIHSADAKGGEYTTKRFAPGASVNENGNWNQEKEYTNTMKPGRFPANIILDGSEEVTSLFPETKSGGLNPSMNVKESTGWSGGSQPDRVKNTFTPNSGSAARFFYCAKASKKERGEGNSHPTVKPLALMEYLVKMVSPPEDGIILDPFLGSGTTGVACKNLKMSFIGIEMDAEYYEIAKTRISSTQATVLS